MSFPELNTPRLLLRQFQSTDTEVIFKLRSDNKVNKYLERQKAVHIMDAVMHMERIAGFYDEGKAINWMLEEKETGNAIGTICIWNIDRENKQADLGYELLPEFQRRGLMNEALIAVTEWSLNKGGFTKLYAWTHQDNEASSKLLIQNQFVRDTEEEEKNKEELNDHVIYSRKQG